MNKFAPAAIIAVAAMAAASSSCSDKHGSIGRFADIPNGGWAYGDTIAFTASGLDSTATDGRRVKIGVRHDNDYAFRNLIVEVTYTDGNRLRRDTIDMQLADIYGAWLGNGLGPSYQTEAVVVPSAAIADSSTLTLRHVMRVDTLRGIEQIGIIIEKP